MKFLGRVVNISTPMGKSGILWRLYNTAARLPSILLYQRPTWEMNPNYPKGCQYLKNEESKNPRTFNREFGAQFDEAVDAMFPLELVDRCTEGSPQPFNRNINYAGAMDTSKKKDAFAFCLGHMHNGNVHIDQVRYWIPKEGRLDWNTVKRDIDTLCHAYGVEQLLHDGYEGEAVKLYFGDYALEETVFTQPYKMKIYSNLEELMYQGREYYPDDERLKKEMKALQKKWNGENFSVHHPNDGPVRNDDGPDVVANLSYHLFKGHVENRDGDYDGPRQKR